MKKHILILCLTTLQSQAAICPDPATSSLQHGQIPPPWLTNPFSNHIPQGDADAHFSRANILVAGIGRGVVCNYQTSTGYYSIWWPVHVKIPARIDYNWLESNMGYACSTSIASCIFHTAEG